MIYLVTSMIRIVAALITGALRILVYLLRVFGLIVPVFYCIAVLVANLVTDNALLGTPQAMGYVTAGFGLSCVGAVLLFFRNTVALPAKHAALAQRQRTLERREREIEQREALLHHAYSNAPPPPPHAEARRGKEAARGHGAAPQEDTPRRPQQVPPQQQYAQGDAYGAMPQGYHPPGQGYKHSGGYADERYDANTQDYTRGSYREPMPNNHGYAAGGGYYPPSQGYAAGGGYNEENIGAERGKLFSFPPLFPKNDAPPIRQQPQRLQQHEQAGREENPQVFRVRQNPEYLIYDYGDRIELYRETETGLEYVRTDYAR